jgi:hypothetical protein
MARSRAQPDRDRAQADALRDCRMKVRIHRFTLYAVAGWVVLLVYFATQDADAALVSLVLTPPLGALLLVAVRQQHLVLSQFMGLAVISHAIAPPFFFLRREFYTYGGGFGAVKDFRFGVDEFLRIYSEVLIFLAAMVLFAVVLRSLWPRVSWDTGLRLTALAPSLTPKARRRYGILLALFLILIAAPLSVFMYANRIGITGVEPTVLPYRLTGIFTYFRMFVVPMVIFAGLALGRRTRPMTVLILLYMAVAGFSSASRYVVLSTAAPLVVFALLDRRIARFLVVASASAAMFVLVTASRDYVYTRQMPLVELVQTTVRGVDAAAFSPFALVGGVANRLWGPQDVVLASQYHTPSRWAAIVNYFSLRTVVENLTFEFYGLTFSGESAGFGVGIGYVPWMIVLANGSLPVLIALAFVAAVLVSVSEWLVTRYRALPGRLPQTAVHPLAFLFVFCLYPSNLNWWYDAVFLSAAGLLVLHLAMRLRRRRSPPPRRLEVHPAPVPHPEQP